MANFIIGSEVKFAIELTALGFDMDTMDFDLELKHTRGSVIGRKSEGGSEDGKLVIYSDSSDSSSSDSSSSDSSSSGEEATWYAIIDTTGFSAGELKVVATAHIVDPKASGGIRNEIAVATLGQLKNA